MVRRRIRANAAGSIRRLSRSKTSRTSHLTSLRCKVRGSALIWPWTLPRSGRTALEAVARDRLQPTVLPD
jgi:hypothetical protein